MGKVADLSVFTPGGQPGAPNPSEGLVVLRQNQTAFMETIGVMPPESLTIADGAISPTTAVCIVDTEGGAPADDLATINATLSDGSTLHDGMVILLSAKDASRVVTVKNSDAPNGVKTVDGKDVVLSPTWFMFLQYISGSWQQVSLLSPATSTTIGGVKVGDGLTMRDGVMSADLATDTEAGRVKASEAAKAGAVPLGGDDGKIMKGWLPSILCNTREILTTSGTYSPPVTGWYRLELRGGGGAGGAGNTTNKSYGGGGGGSGGILVDYAYLTQGESYPYIIGAGGVAKKEFASGTGGDGGETSFTTTSGKKSIAGGFGGGNRGASAPAGISGGDPGPGGFPGGIAGFNTDSNNIPGGSGGMGVTAALSDYTPGQYGSGGAGGYSGHLGHDGVQGCIILDYFDPEKEAV